MSKKTAVQRVKDFVAPKTTPKKQNASQTPPSPEKQPPEKFQSGFGKSKAQAFDPESPLGKLDKRLKAKGLKLKAERAHHLNVTITHETEDSTRSISAQTGENLLQSEADFLYGRAVEELGVVND